MIVKAFSYFYGLLAVVTVIGSVIVMSNSLQPLLVIAGGLIVTLICISGAVAFHTLHQIHEHMTYQSNILKRRSKKTNG